MSPQSTSLELLDELKFTIIKNCGNCVHANLVLSKCILFEAQPPMKVVLSGCESFELDIPF